MKNLFKHITDYIIDMFSPVNRIVTVEMLCFLVISASAAALIFIAIMHHGFGVGHELVTTLYR